MIDWQKLIQELEALGWTRQELADHSGISYSTLCDLANGRSAEPRGNAAVRLNDLHRAKQPPGAATCAASHSSQQQAA